MESRKKYEFRIDKSTCITIDDNGNKRIINFYKLFIDDKLITSQSLVEEELWDLKQALTKALVKDE